MATSPPRAPFNVIDTSGFLYFIQVIIIVTVAAVAAARFVVTNIEDIEIKVASPVADTVEAPLKPNQQNHNINTPSAPRVKLWPGIAFGFPSSEYLPIRGPKIFAPTNAATPPTIWTAVEPAKSWKPRFASHPPPHIQCPEIGYIIALIIRL